MSSLFTKFWRKEPPQAERGEDPDNEILRRRILAIPDENFKEDSVSIGIGFTTVRNGVQILLMEYQILANLYPPYTSIKCSHSPETTAKYKRLRTALYQSKNAKFTKAKKRLLDALL